MGSLYYPENYFTLVEQRGVARIFTISFTHEAIEHAAMVSVRATPFAMEYTVSMLSNELYETTRTEVFLSEKPGHFVFSGNTVEGPTALTLVILKALEDHEHVHL